MIIVHFFILIGFLNTVFMLLPNDNVEVVYLVLNTLQEKVICLYHNCKTFEQETFTVFMIWRLLTITFQKFVLVVDCSLIL